MSNPSASNPPLSASFYNNSDNPLTTNGNNVKQQPSNKKNVLRPVAVRERSKAIPGCKELKNKDDPFSSTINFLIVPPATGGEESKTQELPGKENKPLPVRISVFCDTGTVGTAKVIGGQVRQAFRRNVTSLDVLERLLRHPEGPLQINDQLIGVTDTEDEHNDNNDANTAGVPNFKKGVELADVGLCILEGEREKLAKHLRNLDDEGAKEAFEARAAASKEQQIQQRKQEAAKQKQLQQQQQLQQLTRPPAQQLPSKKIVDRPSGEMQAQMLEKAMANSNSNSNNNQKSSGGNSNRIGRRRNKLNNLRKNRNLDHSKKHTESSAHEMNKTKRRGGKQGAASESNSRSSGDGKKQARSTARVATKMTTITANTGGPTTTTSTANNYDDDHDDSDSDDASSAMSTSEYNKKVADNNNKTPINSFKSCGYEFHFKLPAEVMNQVDQCLRDIAKMNKVVKGVATNGRGTVFLYGNGGVAYTPAIPKALYQKLRQLRSSSFSSRPCFVALGTRDRYYVSFNDGSGDWKASSSLDKMLKKRVIKNPTPDSSAKPNAVSSLPRSVAFGATYDTFFVVFNDGSWEYQGRAIPKSLEKKLRERDDADDLVLCNLGPNGEWFLKAENGKMWWSGISPELDTVLKKITKKGYLHSMDFGENGSYFVSYDEE
jgi:hypothetical protein